MFLDNKYYKWYKALASKQNRSLDCYTEKHHIIPRSMGGKDTKENLVVLTAREHYIAHLLLTKCTFGKAKHKMSFALWNMVNRDNGFRTSSRMYAIIRENHLKFLSESLRGIYKNPDNSVGIIIPSYEALAIFGLEKILEKDVPAGLPYWMVSVEDIPESRTFREAWTVDESFGKPDGFGGESNQFDAELLAKYKESLND